MQALVNKFQVVVKKSCFMIIFDLHSRIHICKATVYTKISNSLFSMEQKVSSKAKATFKRSFNFHFYLIIRLDLNKSYKMT